MHVYGACGAIPGTISGCAFQRMMNSRARASESSKLAASGAGNLSTVCAHSARRPAAAAAFGDRFLEVVHVGEARRPRPDHLRAGERRAERHEIGPDERPLDRHHVPISQTSRRRSSASPRSSVIGACVCAFTSPGITTRPRQSMVSAASYSVPRLADRENRAAGDGDRSGRVHRELLVHRQDMSIGQQEVAGRHGRVARGDARISRSVCSSSARSAGNPFVLAENRARLTQWLGRLLHVSGRVQRARVPQQRDPGAAVGRIEAAPEHRGLIG